MNRVPYYYTVTYKISIPLDIYVDLVLAPDASPELRRVNFNTIRIVASSEADALTEFKSRVKPGLLDELKVLTVQRNEPYDYRSAKAAA